MPQRLADHAHARGVVDVAVGEGLALVQIVPLAHVEEGGRGAVNVDGYPVAIAEHDLQASADDGRDAVDRRALLADSLGVLRRERDDAARAESDAAARRGAGLN